MASKRKSCSNCASLRLQLIEKENEIKRLKKRIENLTDFVLWKDENSNNADDKTNSYNHTDANQSDGDSNDCMIVEEKNKKNQSETGSSNDYIYDKNYQMYYSVSTGYYYDDKSGLMYEPKSCTYYKYDYDKKVYEQVPEVELEKLGVKNDVWEFLKDENSCKTVVDKVNKLNLYDKSSKTKASQSHSKPTNDDEWENPSMDEVLTFHMDEDSSKTRSSLPKPNKDGEGRNPNIVNENSNTVSSEPSKDEDEILYLGSTEDWKPAEGSKMTVTDMVKQVVEEHSNMSDYVYDETYRMYYSKSTGYYYDSVRNLLYDPNSGSYYSYDADKQKYEYYCQAGPKVSDQKKPEPKQSPVKPVDKEKLKSREMYWKKKLGNSKETPEVLNTGMKGHSNETPEALNNCTKEHSKKTLEILNPGIKEHLNESPEALSVKEHLNEILETLNSGMKEHSKETAEDLEADTDENSKNSSELIETSADCDEKDLEDYEEAFSAPEDGEVFSSDEDSNAPFCIVKSPVMGSCSNEQKSSEDSLAPSIRAIVENSEKLQIGSLILITCSGGIIGRDEVQPVYIPDLSVSKVHAEIKYYTQFQSYTIEDLGSQNGTFINEKRLSEPKQKSDPCFLNHGDKLTLGTSRLLLHIHGGHDTCNGCEPGQVLAELSSRVGKGTPRLTKEEMERSRREELRRIKKKYGLQASDFVRKTISIKIKGYEDKAELRRQTVGSDNPYEKTQESSIHVSMPESNKGYQMLKKMGWKEGQTLGTHDDGLTEPIPLCPWTSKAGLGSSGDPSADAGFIPQRKKRNKNKWVKAQERYFQLTLGNDGS